jgi:hypothetical protein
MFDYYHVTMVPAMMAMMDNNHALFGVQRL